MKISYSQAGAQQWVGRASLARWARRGAAPPSARFPLRRTRRAPMNVPVDMQGVQPASRSFRTPSWSLSVRSPFPGPLITGRRRDSTTELRPRTSPFTWRTIQIDFVFERAFGGTFPRSVSAMEPLNLSFSTSTSPWVGFISFDAISYASAAPIPEPETYALMLSGLGVLGTFCAIRRRRAEGRNDAHAT